MAAEVDATPALGPDIGSVVHQDVGDVMVVEKIANEGRKRRDHGDG